MSNTKISFDHYYKYDELTKYLHSISAEYPNLITLESVGQSYEGREIWALAITNKDSGCANNKPAIYIDGNIHAGEVTGSMVCLKLIDYLVNNFNTNEQITYTLNSKTFYVLPRVNPDGAELYLTTATKLRSSTRIYPDNTYTELPGLHPQDINNDNKILVMRVQDNKRGEWKKSNKDSRIMLPRRPGEHNGEFFHLYPEGLIKDYDNTSFDINRSPYGLDLNRNFPSNFKSEFIPGGPYPASEPEVKAIVDFIVNHKNIGLLNCFHTSGGFVFRNPYTYEDNEMDAEDLKATKEIAREYFHIAGYKDIKSNNFSTLTEWAYEHLGIIGYTTELWNRLERAGTTSEEYFNAKTPEEVENIYLKLLKWNDTELCRKGFIDWKKFNHPQLGDIEIGGWDFKYAVQNPPIHLLEQECYNGALWAISQLASMPDCKISNSELVKIDKDVYKITIYCENYGYLPSYITNKGKNIKAVEEDKLFITGDNFELISGDYETNIGFIEGYMNGQSKGYFAVGKPAKSSIKHDFIVKATNNTASVIIKLKSQRGGCDSVEIFLP
ncbi:hypothetical protein IMX26_02210 [Clostridium sp. 'deep sea']|uniref:M14 family metallopeptidase n=1 Tax=Clostridium sp. 'deep sea' TaxID=2779445 RepID=UPI00189670BA|nr:M14 family metallopeptidase [Clostridium sp. 'deep sea']QOR35665.1 hypothetical protein IMX26_02210 [Clostridium sp. 'deep sea']